ncbi:MAG: hypothetical protein Q9221_003328 [Calogaya cf. arnoldii]
MKLPLELRNMIYREIVLSQIDDTGLKKLWHDHWNRVRGPKPKDQGHELRRNDALNLMLTNTRIKDEASAILSKERFLRSTILWGSFGRAMVTVADDEIPLRSLHPVELLRASRNIEISIPSAWRYYHYIDLKWHAPIGDCDDHFEPGQAEVLSVLCNNLASQAQRLKSVLVYLPCYCSTDCPTASYDHMDKKDSQRCFPANGLAPILEPLLRIRARRIRFVHGCKSPVIAELHAVFEDLIATVESSTPVLPLSYDEIEWCDLWQEAHQRVCPWELSDHLLEAWCYMNSRFTQLRPPRVEPAMYQDKYRHHLQEARTFLETHKWDEDSMSAVAAFDYLSETSTIWSSRCWDEDLMSSVGPPLS